MANVGIPYREMACLRLGRAEKVVLASTPSARKYGSRQLILP